MIQPLVFACIAVSIGLQQDAVAHPGAINLYVDASRGDQIYPIPTYEPGGFQLFPGIEISSETPGISVGFPANGFGPGERLMLEIAEGLLYWDGAGLTSTSARIRVLGPTFDLEGSVIQSDVTEYLVDQDSRVQKGMLWGTYSGNSFWEADGLYLLEDLQAPRGIYGLAYRVSSPGYRTSEPFLVPFVYDPTNQWNLAQRANGISQLRSAMQRNSSDFDDDGDYDCQDVNALTLVISQGGNTPEFDLTGDGLVDAADLTHWLADAGSANLPSRHPYLVGDANLDGIVDGSDFNAWNAGKFSSNTAWCGGDFNADGVVDGSDFNSWNAHKFTAADASWSVVPEPQAWTLAWTALLASAVCVKHRHAFRAR